jgi:putative membrane protein
VTTSEALAVLNAGLTTIALACAIQARRAIRRGQVTRHKRLMLGALGASVAFSMVFVFRYAMFGPATIKAQGGARVAYLVLLTSHEALAVAVTPAVLATAAVGLFGARAAHRDIARMTLPLWIYVMATGLVIYLLLYIYPGR